MKFYTNSQGEYVRAEKTITEIIIYYLALFWNIYCEAIQDLGDDIYA